MIQFKENARTDGRKDGQTLFYRTPPATTGELNKKVLNNASDAILQRVID